MPSPIAHTSLIFFGLPAAEGRVRLALPRRVVLAAMVAFVLVLPDFDFVLSLLGLTSASSGHGSWSHSLVWVVPVGLAFALAAWPVFGKGHRPPFARLALVGAGAFASHILMDWTNWGFDNARGVEMFWPVTSERFLSPLHLFVGVRWSEPGAYGSHLLTLATESLFAAVMYGLARTLRMRRARRWRGPGEGAAS